MDTKQVSRSVISITLYSVVDLMHLRFFYAQTLRAESFKHFIVAIIKGDKYMYVCALNVCHHLYMLTYDCQ